MGLIGRRGLGSRNGAARVSEQPDPRVVFIQQQAQRALDRQAARLESVRARAGTVLAAGSISGAVLGDRAFSGGQVAFAGWLGAAALAILVCALLAVLWPWQRWCFITSPQALIDDYLRAETPAEMDEMLELVACHQENDYESNERKLRWLYRALALSTLVLGVEIVAFLFSLRSAKP